MSLLISILRLNLVLTYGIPPEVRGGVYISLTFLVLKCLLVQTDTVFFCYSVSSFICLKLEKLCNSADTYYRILTLLWYSTVVSLLYCTLENYVQIYDPSMYIVSLVIFFGWGFLLQ